MVGVVARLGGEGECPNEVDRWFLVPEDEYDARPRFGFVVDLARHEEVIR